MPDGPRYYALAPRPLITEWHDVGMTDSHGAGATAITIRRNGNVLRVASGVVRIDGEPYTVQGFDDATHTELDRGLASAVDGAGVEQRDQHWGLPAGTIGSVDLAPIGGQSYVFATSDAPFNGEDVAAKIGDGTPLAEYSPNASERTAWADLLGVTWPGGKLLDALWQILTVDADPDAELRCKPIMPTHKGILELHLGGHSLIRSERMTRDPTQHPAWAAMQRVMQNDYAGLHGRDNAIARKWLGAMQRKYRLSPEAARDLLIPQGLPRELPLKPTTTLSDDFTDTDGTSLDAHTPTDGGGWSWSEVVGAAEIQSNAASCTSSPCLAQAGADLSSADMYASAHWSSIEGGPSVRTDGSQDTGYHGRCRTGFTHIYRTSNGSEAGIAGGDDARPATGKLQVDGSSLTLWADGVEVITATDTNISAGVRAGMRWDGTQSGLDNFEAADLVASGAAAFPFQLYYQMQGASL